MTAPRWQGDNRGAVVNLPEADARYPSRLAAWTISHYPFCRRYFIIIIIVVNFHRHLLIIQRTAKICHPAIYRPYCITSVS